MNSRMLLLAAACVAALAGAACGKDDAATTTTPTPVPADPTITESFSAALPVGGTVFYSFNMPQYGVVNVTLTSLTAAELPEGFTVSLGIGRPAGQTCNVTTSLSTVPGSTPQVSGNFGPGIYCVRVYDAGFLTTPARVAVTVAHS